MFSVIFEVLPDEGKKDAYLALAKHLKPIVESIDGFIDNERFESLSRPGWVLSHSTWRDEKSVVRWRTQGEHERIRSKGRSDIFQDYHLRVGEITADSDPPRDVPLREQRLDTTEVGEATLVTFTEITPANGVALAADRLAPQLGLDLQGRGIANHDAWASINSPGKMALLVGWKDAKAGSLWRPKMADGITKLRHRAVRVIRDYGRFDRREAPQFYEDVKGRATLHARAAEAVK